MRKNPRYARINFEKKKRKKERKNQVIINRSCSINHDVRESEETSAKQNAKNVICATYLKSEFTRDQMTHGERARDYEIYTWRLLRMGVTLKFCNLMRNTPGIRSLQFPKRTPDFEAFCTPTYIEKKT